MVIYPSQYAYMQPLAERCVLVMNREDWEVFRGDMTDEVTEAFTDLYRRIREKGDFDRLEEIMDDPSRGLEEWASEVWPLILTLNYMIEDGLIPPSVAPKSLIEWDHREFDDDGNEW